QWYSGQWFTTVKKLATFKKKEAERIAKEKGWVKTKFGWVDPIDLPFLERGMVRSEDTGVWVTEADLKRQAEGWVKQDLEWVSPDDMHNIEEGLWYVNGEWMELDSANEYHAMLNQWWAIPTPEVMLFATTTRETAVKALDEMERGIRDLKRIFGRTPAFPLQVALLRNQEQYDRFALGDPNYDHEPTHQGRMFSINRAFLAESWFADTEMGLTHRAAGVGYWDTSVENGDAFGVHTARLAVAHSFLDAIDPSPKILAKVSGKGPGSNFREDYLSEKTLPEWLAFGIASYVERWYRDTNIQSGGDPFWVRKWSAETIKAGGGLRSVSQIIMFPFSANDPADSKQLMTEAGLLVAYMLDAEGEPLKKEFDAFRDAFNAGDLNPKVIKAMEKALEKHEEQITAFAGL
ncbi:MAG: hypothetical protein ACI841_005303, partial [Planctomycetota bacterium]